MTDLEEVKKMVKLANDKKRPTGNPKGNIKSWTARQLKVKYTCTINNCNYLAQNLNDLREHKLDNHAY